jgi:hypothetical protein
LGSQGKKEVARHQKGIEKKEGQTFIIDRIKDEDHPKRKHVIPCHDLKYIN